ncbi:putative transferase CAF17 homolog, mitochondrial [Amyelois transitella]|uniref:putative transferase CAF17 homolog, mitochondrial n=1 Tax=Amyelois transitella TaxID=680683 RepID=UPI00299041FB|nr:putative transferase CAF17 homolog, mitochondrial [Amyelois transitella]
MLLNQVNRFAIKRSFLNQFYRCTHTKNTNVLYPLESRRLIKVKGKDAPVFLQGLITNDMRHFDEGAQSMYAMFLNNKGRVLYDTLIHKWETDDSFLIECDKNVTSLLQKHLKLFKLKRSLDIVDMNQDFRIWSLISPTSEPIDVKPDQKSTVKLYKDPRLVDLGYRVLTSPALKGSEVAERIGENIKTEENEDGYKYLRYTLGVGEGAEDLVPTKMTDKSKEQPEQVVYNFQCSVCGMTEKANYKGTNPPFSRNIELKWPSYVMKDPFSPPGKGEILVLGADCAMCNKCVCINKECSIFYTKMFCFNCAHNSIDKLPTEIKSKFTQLRKQ